MFSVAPSTTARRCISPLASNVDAACHPRDGRRHANSSIWLPRRSSSVCIFEASQAFMVVRDSAPTERPTGTERWSSTSRCRSHALLVRSPSGRRTAQWYLRVDTYSVHQPERPLEPLVANAAWILPALQTHLVASIGREPVAAALSRGCRGSPSRSAYELRCDGPRRFPWSTMSGPAHGRGVLGPGQLGEGHGPVLLGAGDSVRIHGDRRHTASTIRVKVVQRQA